MHDNKVLYCIDCVTLTVKDVQEIYDRCRTKIEGHKNDLYWLYEFFGLKHKGCLGRSDDADTIAKRIDILQAQ